MKEKLLDAVLRVLDENKGKHKEFAADSGVPYSTISKISQRITLNPGVQSVQVLADFFKGSKLL